MKDSPLFRYHHNVCMIHPVWNRLRRHWRPLSSISLFLSCLRNRLTHLMTLGPLPHAHDSTVLTLFPTTFSLNHYLLLMCSRHLPKYFPDNVQSTHVGKTSIFPPSLHLSITMTGAALTRQYSTSQSIQLRHSLDHQLALLDGTQFVSCCIQQSHRFALSSHSSQITAFHSLAPHQSLICSQKDGL